ncbi:MAG: GAF domain-containing protein, partial [Proteobacteria bacterium]|nr:GAF domain-containing protein [Pseudomonadota bacterium]
MIPNVPQASYGYIVPSLLGVVVLLGLALLAILRGGGRRTNLLFAAISFLAALLNADIALVSILPDEQLALRVDRTIHLFFVFSIPVYIMFVHEFLGIRRRWLEIAALLFSIAFIPIVPTDLYYSGVHYYSFGRIARAGPLFHLFSAAIAVMIAYCLALLHRFMRNTEDNLQRNRIKYIFWGMGLSALLLAFTILPVSGVPVYPLGNFSFIPAAFLAYGVLKYDLLDIGVLIRRGTVYFLLTGILTVLYILIISLFHVLFLSGGEGGSFAISVVLALVIVLLFNPIRERLQAIIDRLFFRGRYDYQELLREISGKMATLLNVGQIRGLLIGTIGEALQVEGVSLVMAEGEGFSLYEGGSATGEGKAPPADVGVLMSFLGREGRPLSRAAVERSRIDAPEQKAIAGILDSLRAALVIPIPSRERLAGMIALGQKKSGELFVDEDLKLLTTIANQAATAVENAQSYEVLEAFNRELEQKVALRTAALREALAEKERTQEQLIRSESLSS